MKQRLSALVLIATFVIHATGLSLAVHIHTSHQGGHDSQACAECQALISGAAALPRQPEAITFDASASTPAPCLGDPVRIGPHDDIPPSPRAPPAA